MSTRPSTHEGDHYFKGQVTLTAVDLPAASVENAQVANDAGIQAEKLEHDHRALYAQESATTAAAETRVVHVVRGTTGEVVEFAAGNVVACTGTSEVSVDLLCNGSSILSSAITLDSTTTPYALVTGTISAADLEDDDVLEIEIDTTAPTGSLAKGAFAQIWIREDGA